MTTLKTFTMLIILKQKKKIIGKGYRRIYNLIFYKRLIFVPSGSKPRSRTFLRTSGGKRPSVVILLNPKCTVLWFNVCVFGFNFHIGPPSLSIYDSCFVHFRRKGHKVEVSLLLPGQRRWSPPLYN